MALSISSIKEICLYVSDLAKTRGFYEKVLGFSVISQVEGRHVFFRVGPQVLLCFNPKVTKHEKKLPPHYAIGKQHIALEVRRDEYSEWKQKLEEAGVIILHEQHWKEDLYSCYFHDPDGHVLELVPPGIWD